MEDVRRRVEPGVALVASLCAVLLIYRGAYESVPRADHLYMLWGRFLTGSDGAAFLEALDWNRTRAAGESLLFRPLLHAIPTAVTLWSDGSLRVLGLTDLAMHATAAWALYLALRTRSGPLFSSLGALLYAAQYPGIEMVLWAAVAPYACALACFAIGSIVATREGSRAAWAVLPLALAGTFHEAAVVCLVPPAVVACLRPTTRRLGAILLAAVAIYAAFDLLDALRTMSQWKPASDESAAVGPTLLRACLLLSGALARALIAPASVDLEMSTPWGRMTWDLVSIERELVLWGILPFLAMLALGGWLALRVLRDRAAAHDWLRGLWLSHLLVFLVAVGALRVHEKGVAYLSASTYDLAYLGFLSIGVLGMAPLSRTVRAGVAVAATALCVVQIHSVRRIVSESFAYGRTVDAVTQAIDRAVGWRPELCYGGALDAAAAAVQPPLWSFLLVEPELVCRADDARTAVYLTGDDGSWSLASLGPAIGRVAQTVGPARDEGPIDVRDLVVRVPDGVEAMLRLGVRGDDSVVLQVAADGSLHAWIWRADVAREIHVLAARLLPGEPRTLRVVWASDRFWLLQGPRVFGPLVDVPRLEGALGIEVPPGAAVSWTIGEAAPARTPVLRLAP